MVKSLMITPFVEHTHHLLDRKTISIRDREVASVAPRQTEVFKTSP